MRSSASLMRDTVLEFTSAEADLLGRTADALSAWTGKPVLAEIISETDAGYEWVLFAVPLQPGESAPEDQATVQVGGPQARFVGSRGGLDLADGQMLDCALLWAIQLSDEEGVRFIKVDAQGEEAAWSPDLLSLLPFNLDEPAIDDPDDDPSD